MTHHKWAYWIVATFMFLSSPLLRAQNDSDGSDDYDLTGSRHSVVILHYDRILDPALDPEIPHLERTWQWLTNLAHDFYDSAPYPSNTTKRPLVIQGNFLDLEETIADFRRRPGLILTKSHPALLRDEMLYLSLGFLNHERSEARAFETSYQGRIEPHSLALHIVDTSDHESEQPHLALQIYWIKDLLNPQKGKLSPLEDDVLLSLPLDFGLISQNTTFYRDLMKEILGYLMVMARINAPLERLEVEAGYDYARAITYYRYREITSEKTVVMTMASPSLLKDPHSLWSKITQEQKTSLSLNEHLFGQVGAFESIFRLYNLILKNPSETPSTNQHSLPHDVRFWIQSVAHALIHAPRLQDSLKEGLFEMLHQMKAHRLGSPEQRHLFDRQFVEFYLIHSKEALIRKGLNPTAYRMVQTYFEVFIDILNDESSDARSMKTLTHSFLKELFSNSHYMLPSHWETSLRWSLSSLTSNKMTQAWELFLDIEKLHCSRNLTR